MKKGCVLTGGSAGAICWFDSGHSDSADPETYVQPMLEQHGGDKSNNDDNNDDESSAYDASNQRDWKYLRVPGLGLVPGPFVCCPHHDRIQSNGALRARDFDRMLLARAGKPHGKPTTTQHNNNTVAQTTTTPRPVLGIGIDHYASFIVEGDNYRVYSLPGRAGSVPPQNDNITTRDATSGFAVDDDGTARGTPGVWIKRVVVVGGSDGDGATRNVVEAMVCPPEGKLADLLAYAGADFSTRKNNNNNAGDWDDEDDEENRRALEQCRRDNPCVPKP